MSTDYVAYSQKLEKVIEELTINNQRYDEILKKVFQDKKAVGVIVAGPEEEMYRVQEKSGANHLILKGPHLDAKDLGIGKSVIFTEKMILSLLPTTLEIKREPPKFKHIKWDEIGGMSSQIEEIREIVEQPLKNKDIYKEFGLPMSKGLLLFGPPGCGKTLIAKAIASKFLEEMKEPTEESFVYVKGGELLKPYVGESEGMIQSIFTNAREHFKKYGHQSVVFIDEADAIMPKRGSRRSSDVDSTIVPTFLAEMDGFEDGNPFIILATNLPDSLDEAVIREGRVDLKVEIKRPQMEDVVEIFKIHLSKTKVAKSIDIQTLSEESTEELFNTIPDIDNKVSGALIENIVKSAAQIAIKRKITDKDSILGVVSDDINQSISKLNKNESIKKADGVISKREFDTVIG